MKDNGESQNGTKTGDYQIPDDLLLVSMEVENVMRIQAAAIHPTPDLTKIGGKNANGKSTLIDSVSRTLCGGSAVPAEALRRGQRKGFDRTRIESRSDPAFGLIAERQYRKGSDKLVVMFDGDTEPRKAPQGILSALYNANAGQPDDFLDLKPADMRAMLQKLVGIDFTTLDADRAKAYSERTFVNREAKALEGKVDALPRYPEAKEAVDTSALQAELTTANTTNAAAEAAEREIETLFAQSSQYDDELERLRARAVEIKTAKATIQTQMTEAAGKAVEPVDAQAIIDRLINAQELNDKVEANVRRREAETEMRNKTAEALKLTLAIENIDAEKAKQLAEAKFPVPGLGFSDDGVLLNDLPFEQASEKEQLVAAAAICLAQQPKLKALRFQRGSLLDSENEAALRQFAKDNQCQIFFEVVASKDKQGKYQPSDCAVIIEDGLITERNESGE